jgi:hypothetical protein
MKTAGNQCQPSLYFELWSYSAAVAELVSAPVSSLPPVHAPRNRELRTAKITYFIVFSFETVNYSTLKK